MAMLAGERGAQINVTPAQTAPRIQRDVELWAEGNGDVRLDGETMPLTRLPGRLNTILKTNSIGAVLVHGNKNLDFEDVAAVIDEVRGAGLKQIAVLTN